MGRTHHDPEDDSCSKPDRTERLLERADQLHDERKDREMERLWKVKRQRLIDEAFAIVERNKQTPPTP